jgi:hypothetical protein
MVRNSEISPSAELTPATSKRHRAGSDDDGMGEYQRLYYAQMETEKTTVCLDVSFV